MCLKICHRADYQMDYSNSLLNSLSRSTQNLIQSSSQLTHEAYNTFRHHSSLHSSSSSSSLSTAYRAAAFNNHFRPANSMDSNSLTQSICQSLAQSSGLVVRLAKLVLDLYCSTMDLSFLVQLFTFGLDQTGIDLELNFDRYQNESSERPERNEDDKEDRCDEDKRDPQVKRIPFTPTVDDHPVHNLPDIITTHQRVVKNLQQKQDLIDIGRKLRFIAEQFEKQRSAK